LLDDSEQVVDVLTRQRAGGFIEDEEFGAMDQSAGDFHKLTCARGQPFHRIRRFEFAMAQLRENFADTLSLSAATQHSETVLLPAEHDVVFDT
jgi:hypothetical protein